MFPKIELHVHLEGTIRAGTLLQIARRNNVPLPGGSVEGLAALNEFRDFAHFLEVWRLTTAALRTEQDFRQVVVDYAAEAAGHGAVYLEGIFTRPSRCAAGPGGTRCSAGTATALSRPPSCMACGSG
jgi:aminodeoxyfutalosine deaminase